MQKNDLEDLAMNELFDLLLTKVEKISHNHKHKKKISQTDVAK